MPDTAPFTVLSIVDENAGRSIHTSPTATIAEFTSFSYFNGTPRELVEEFPDDLRRAARLPDELRDKALAALAKFLADRRAMHARAQVTWAAEDAAEIAAAAEPFFAEHPDMRAAWDAAQPS